MLKQKMLTVPSNIELEGYFEGTAPLKETEVYKVRSHYGPNVVSAGKRRQWYQLLWGSLFHPFNILLMLLATTSGFAGEYETMGTMLIMVFLSTVLRFHQEWKSEVAVDTLLKFVATKVTVIRNDLVLFKDMEYVIPSTELFPGDWIKLSPGELVPADVEIISGTDFHVSQAALTGEALPVLKYARQRKASWMSPTAGILNENLLERNEKAKNSFLMSSSNIKNGLWKQMGFIFGFSVALVEGDKNSEAGVLDGVNFSDMERPDVCFMGSAVISGKATCRVVNTGVRTAFGKLAKGLTKERPQNTFQQGVRRISWLFFILMLCMIPPVLLLQGILHHDWFDAFMFALSVAVGLTPEMLPMIVNTTLAKGAVEMAKKRCLVKQLDAIINMGSTSVLCTDKTGTLTKSVVTLHKYVNAKGSTSSVPLLLGHLNASFQSCHDNPLDLAIISFQQDQGHSESVRNAYTFIGEIPFDFVRRRTSVVLESNQKSILICKGAVEETLAVCTSVLSETFGGSMDISTLTNAGSLHTEVMTQEKLASLKSLDNQFSNDGMRLIAVAYKPVNAQIGCNLDDECGLTFAGFLAFLDPPKESTAEAIKILMEHEVKVKVLTGDNPLVCKKICTEIGLKVDHVITGKEIASMLPPGSGVGVISPELRSIAEEYAIFAKLTPTQKSDIVKALKLNGHVVSFLGDGINDASALAEADVGISVDTGMDICKEAADIILLEKDLTVIADAVVVGRKTFGNTLKYIVMGTSAAFGNVFSILIASAWLPFQPMQSLHILVQNLLYDVSQLAIPWDKMDPEYLLVPHQWSMKKVVKFMVMIGPWSSIFDIATFLFLYFYFRIQTADNHDKVLIFQSSWFCVGTLTQTLIVHLIRTKKVPFVESLASYQMTFMTITIMVIGLCLPYIPGVNQWLMLVPLPWEMYPFMGAVMLTYCIVIQFSKYLYMKLFNEWY